MERLHVRRIAISCNSGTNDYLAVVLAWYFCLWNANSNSNNFNRLQEGEH